jgi:hypothetical protein
MYNASVNQIQQNTPCQVQFRLERSNHQDSLATALGHLSTGYDIHLLVGLLRRHA